MDFYQYIEQFDLPGFELKWLARTVDNGVAFGIHYQKTNEYIKLEFLEEIGFSSNLNTAPKELQQYLERYTKLISFQ